MGWAYWSEEESQPCKICGAPIEKGQPYYSFNFLSFTEARNVHAKCEWERCEKEAR